MFRLTILYTALFIISTSELSFSQTTVFKGRITWLDLITNFETSRYGIKTEADLEQRIIKNGNLHLDSSYLFLDAKKEQNLFLIFNEVSLNETRIITNGNTLTIFCNKLICTNSAIISFTPNYLTAINDGKNNYSGKRGGIVRIVVLNQMQGKLNVFLDGQNGANGFDGLNNEQTESTDGGYSYTETSVNVDTYYDPTSNKHRRGSTTRTVNKEGLTSKKYIYATNGEDGGNGGDGGTLLFLKTKQNNDSISAKIHFTAFAGTNGIAGKGGKGSDKDGEKTLDGEDGIPGKPGFMKIEIYNFEDLFINH
ncbi:MAG: hypothetical protein V4667_04630 [Bacteroidota bacterium]